MASRLTLKKITEDLSNISPTIEITSDVFVHCCEKLNFKCKICGYEWSTTWNSVKKGSGCAKCAGVLKLTMPEVREKLFVITPTIKITSEEYVQSHGKLDLLCTICGYEWKATWTDLSQGKGCPCCSKVMRQTLEQARERLKGISPTITIMSKEYHNARKNLDVRCEICGHEWKATWDNLFHGKGCPKCDEERRKGSTSSSWKGGITPVKNYLRGAVFQWRKDSMRECKYKCVITGNNFDHIHHIHNFSSIVYETFDICGIPLKPKVIDYTEQELLQLSIVCNYLHDEYGLGKCLTKELHKEFHSIYGYRNNTLKQFEEFVELKQKEMGLKLGNLQ